MSLPNYNRLALFTVSFFAMQLLCAVENNAARPNRVDEHSAIYHPAPEYPNEARRRRFEGNGLFRLDVEDGTGKVTNVSVIKSTGHKMLDKAGIEAFYKWRFPHGPATSVRVPLQFKLEEVSVEDAIAQVTYSPAPVYPILARQFNPAFLNSRRSASGSGLFVLIIDRETGKVTQVTTVLSTGQKVLDDAAISAFSRWRFKPKTQFRAVRVPITFLEQQSVRYH